MFTICLSHLLIILHWILSVKNHIIFLAASIWFFECHSQQRDHVLSLNTWHSNHYQLSIWLIFQISSFYYFSFKFLQSVHSIDQSNWFSLSSQACQLFSSVSLLSCVQFSWLNFLWLKFSHSFFCYLFVWLISFSCLRFWLNLLLQMTILSCAVSFLRSFSFALFLIMSCLFVWDFSQVYFYKLLSDLMQHSQKDLLFASLNIWSCAAFLEKILFSSLNFNTETSIFLAFVYYRW